MQEGMARRCTGEGSCAGGTVTLSQSQMLASWEQLWFCATQFGTSEFGQFHIPNNKFHFYEINEINSAYFCADQLQHMTCFGHSLPIMKSLWFLVWFLNEKHHLKMHSAWFPLGAWTVITAFSMAWSCDIRRLLLKKKLFSSQAVSVVSWENFKPFFWVSGSHFCSGNKYTAKTVFTVSKNGLSWTS